MKRLTALLLALALVTAIDAKDEYSHGPFHAGGEICQAD